MAATDRSDIWGVGRRIAALLREEGLKSALDLMRLASKTGSVRGR